VGEWITLFWGESGDCTSCKTATLRAIMVLQEMGLVSFGSLFGPYAGVVKRVVGVGQGARSSRTFFFNFVTLRNRKDSSQTLAITMKVSQSLTSISWHCGLAASEMSRSIFVPPCRGLVIQRVAAVGGAACTCADKECASLSAAARFRLDKRRCFWLRCKGMRRRWSYFWLRVRTRRRRNR